MATATMAYRLVDVSWKDAAKAVVGINLFDCLFTLAFLHLGLCTEANPAMRVLLDCSPAAFILVKVGLVNASVGLLASLSQHRSARAAMVAIAGVYGLLATYELAGLVEALRQV